MPPSQPATSKPPTRGETATTSPATISTAPMMYMASWPFPGTQVIELGCEVLRPVADHDFGELVETEQDRRDRERDPQQHEGLRGGVASQQLRSGIGIGRRAAAMALLMVRLLWHGLVSWRPPVDVGGPDRLSGANGAELTSRVMARPVRGREAHAAALAVVADRAWRLGPTSTWRALVVRLAALYELEEAVVVLVARRAALEAGEHSRDSIIRVCTCSSELYELVDLLEALVAQRSGSAGPSSRLRASSFMPLSMIRIR